MRQAHIVLAALVFGLGLVSGAHAQTVRVAATIETIDNDEVVTTLCARCVPGANATFEFSLVTSHSCEVSGCTSKREYTLGSDGNSGRITLNGESWSIDGGLVMVDSEASRSAIRLLYASGSPPGQTGSVRTMPFVQVFFASHPLDGHGLASINEEPDWGSGASLQFCPGGLDQLCTARIGLRVQLVVIGEEEGQRDKAKRLACSAPPGSLGREAICPNFSRFFVQLFANLCAGEIGDFYLSNVDHLNEPATDSAIERWARLETEYFRLHGGCTALAGSIISEAGRIEGMRSARDKQP